MATNPNVPADQKAAAEMSAPDAKVTAQQPAQLSTGTQATTTAAPVANTQAAPAAGVATAQPAAKSVPVDSTKRDDSGSDRKAQIAEEQKDLKDLSKKVESGNLDYFEQQEAFAKIFEEKQGEDSFRRQTRIERELEALQSAGDPTRDPVAKQQAMDMNTVLPGAVEDAQKIKDIGAQKADEEAERRGTK